MSEVPKMDMIKIWANRTDTDIMVLSETWLKKGVSNDEIAIDGYNVFRSERRGKEGEFQFM